LIVLIIVLAAAAAAGGFAVTDALRPTPTPTPPPPTPRAYVAAGASPSAAPPATSAPAPTAAGLARDLAPLLGAAGLGARLRADVVDVAAGTDLFARGATAPTAPASTAKLLTAAAVLAVRPAGYR